MTVIEAIIAYLTSRGVSCLTEGNHPSAWYVATTRNTTFFIDIRLKRNYVEMYRNKVRLSRMQYSDPRLMDAIDRLLDGGPDE
jgi:hypothetical protein